jgi:hypothetical protein
MRGIVARLIALMGGVVFADDAVSPAFTFDARYKSSDITPDAWVSYEAEGLSSRFSAATVTRVADANGNGIPDEWESRYGLVGDNADVAADPDGDGRTNLEEYNAGTSPIVAEDHLASVATSGRHVVDTWIESTAVGGWDLVEVWGLSGLFMTDTAGRAPDADKDGLPDWWETLYGLNPNVADSHVDSDGDGRTNLEEYNAGTNPIIFNDWMRSIAEQDKSFICDTHVEYIGGNPTFDSTFAVIKVSNGFVCDTGGLYYDWDGDGIPNWWEARFSRNGSKTGLDASTDDDADGMSNYGEFVAYTNPTNGNSKFTIAIVPMTEEKPASDIRQPTMMAAGRRLSNVAGSTNFALKWQSAQGRIYSVYATPNLSEGWPETPTAEILGTGDVLEYVPEQTDAVQFFKVSVRLIED